MMGDIDEILKGLDNLDFIVPVFYIRRIKTNKFYYAFCSHHKPLYGKVLDVKGEAGIERQAF